MIGWLLFWTLVVAVAFTLPAFCVALILAVIRTRRETGASGLDRAMKGEEGA